MNKTLVLGAIVMITLGTTVVLATHSASGAMLFGGFGGGVDDRKAPLAITGDNVYVAWWTNDTANKDDDIMFRASTDNGATFNDKINLSNTTGAESQDAELAAEGDSVIITWWERNATSNEPVLRTSTDNGATFGPLLKLASNGTIGESE